MFLLIDKTKHTEKRGDKLERILVVWLLFALRSLVACNLFKKNNTIRVCTVHIEDIYIISKDTVRRGSDLLD